MKKLSRLYVIIACLVLVSIVFLYFLVRQNQNSLTLKEDVNTLIKEKATLEKRIATLTEENNSLTKKVSQLTKEVGGLAKELNLAKSQFDYNCAEKLKKAIMRFDEEKENIKICTQANDNLYKDIEWLRAENSKFEKALISCKKIIKKVQFENSKRGVRIIQLEAAQKK